jgi:hypothetical protein
MMGLVVGPVRTTGSDDRTRVSGRYWLIAVIVLTWIGAAAVCVLRIADASPADEGPAGWCSSVVLAAVLATPGAVALIGYRSRTRAVLIAAGVSLVPLGLISILTLPLVVVATLFVVAGIHMPGRSSLFAALLSCVVVATTVATPFVMFVHQDPRSVETPTMGAAVSDVVTPLESFAGSIMVALTLVLAELAALSRPGRSVAAARS